MADSPHQCPAECGRPVPWKQFACPEDWRRLPETMRSDIMRTWRARKTNQRAHYAAMLAAVNWFRAHPARVGADR